MNGKSMVEGAPWKSIVKFAIPVLLGSLLQQLYNTIDTIIVGKYVGQSALAAVGTTGSFAFFFLAIAIGFSSGNGIVIAQFFGARNMEKVKRNASTGILFLLILGVSASIAGFLLAYPAFKYVLLVPDELIDQTLLYFRTYAVGLIFMYGYNSISSILRGIGDSAATLFFLFVSSVLNIMLDFLFVAIFRWGVMGAAVATDISQFVSLMAAYFYMTKKYEVFDFSLKDLKMEAADVANTVMVGMPIALQMVVISCGLTFIQRAVNKFGEDMIASFAAGQRIEMYINLPCTAMQTTLATYTGQNIGANRMDRVKKGVRQAMIISLIITLIISLLIWMFPEFIMHKFSLSPKACEYCFQHLRTIALVNIILAMYIPLFGLYQGAGHSLFPMIVATAALSIRVLVTYLFRYSDFLGYRIIWWNGLFGFGAGFLLAWTYYFSKLWQKSRRFE